MTAGRRPADHHRCPCKATRPTKQLAVNCGVEAQTVIAQKKNAVIPGGYSRLLKQENEPPLPACVRSPPVVSQQARCEHGVHSGEGSAHTNKAHDEQARGGASPWLASNLHCDLKNDLSILFQIF